MNRTYLEAPSCEVHRLHLAALLLSKLEEHPATHALQCVPFSGGLVQGSGLTAGECAREVTWTALQIRLELENPNLFRECCGLEVCKLCSARALRPKRMMTDSV